MAEHSIVADLYMDDSLQWTQKLVEDTSIARKQVHYFLPDNGVQYNTAGNISLNIYNSDDFYFPADSYLEITGNLYKKGTTTAFAAADVMGFSNYGQLNLFTLARYNMNGSPIESVSEPGVVATMLGVSLLPNDYRLGLEEGYYPDTAATVTDLTGNKGWIERRALIWDGGGKFQILVPLSRVFGFAEDYKKVIYGMNHSIVLTRGTHCNNALTTRPTKAAPDPYTALEGEVVLNSIRWVIPRVDPSDVAKYQLQKQIQNHILLDCGFRMREYQSASVEQSTHWTWRIGVRSSPEKPRFILISFQTDLRDSQEKNNSVFSHCSVTNMNLTLNSDRYPLNDFTSDFDTNTVSNLYWEFMNFRREYYGIDNRISSISVCPLRYKTLYPIYCFDVTRQSERLKTSVTDICLSCTFKAKVPANTVAHAVIISDRRIKFQSSGTKMSVVW